MDSYMSKWCALWNPTTGESRVLPKHDHYPLAGGCHRLACRFGFGHHDGDWKVVKIVEDWHHYYVRFWAWMYELGSDSWKISPIGIHSRSHFSRDYAFNRTVACWRDGRMYSWMAYQTIVSFDMANKDFTTDHIPDFPIPDGSSLLTLNNLLALFCRRSCRLSELSDIWVLLQHDVRESWTKLWSIRLGPDPHLALEFWNGGLVFRRRGEDRLQWCDLGKSQVKITLPVAYETGSSEVVAFEKMHASLADLRWWWWLGYGKRIARRGRNWLADKCTGNSCCMRNNL